MRPIWLEDRAILPATWAIAWLARSTVILAVGLLAGRMARERGGPAIRSAIDRTTLLAVLLVPAAPALLGSLGINGLAIHRPVADRLGMPASRPLGPIEREAIEGRPAAGSTTALNAGTRPLAGPTAGPATAEAPVGPRPDRDWLAIVASLALVGWLLGSAWLAGRLLVGWRRTSRLRRTAIPAGPEADAIGLELARGMGRGPVPILRSPFVASPCLVGIGRPAILLPEADGDGLRIAIAHELAHLARRDLAWDLLGRLVRVALWPQPMLWILARRMEATAEEASDDAVVRLGIDRVRYAGHLVDLAERMVASRAPIGVGMIAERSSLAGRIARILDESRSPSTRAPRGVAALTLIVGMAATLLAGLIGAGVADRESIAALQAPEGDPPANPPAVEPVRPVVARAIADGVGYLKSIQADDGSWPRHIKAIFPEGINALATLALLRAGEPADEPHVARALARLRRFRPDALDFQALDSGTYEVALQTLAFAAGGGDRDRIAANVAWLVRSQRRADDLFNSAGSWGYGTWRDGVGDNSNSYFALLALDAAREAGAAVAPEVWEASRVYWTGAQKADGSWGYRQSESSQSTGSMTCAGVVALAIVGRARPDLAEGDRPVEADIQRGMDWLAGRFSVLENAGMKSTWRFYYLASLERAGTLSGRRTLGGHDWYREGAEALVGDQDRATGAWRGTGIEGDPGIATSFALLFLGQGRPPVALGPAAPSPR